jgi:hypothetical protein
MKKVEKKKMQQQELYFFFSSEHKIKRWNPQKAPQDPMLVE